MFKKILFYGVTFILGIMLLMTSYYGFYASFNQSMTYKAIETNDYDKIAEIFVPFFNRDKALDVIEEKEFQIVAYEGVVGEKTKVTIDKEEHEAYRYQDSVVFFVNQIKYNLNGVSQGENEPTKNMAGLTFYNTVEVSGENKKLKYEYTLNDPIDAVDDKAEGVKRMHVNAAQQLKFFEVDLSTNIINEKLGGAIDEIAVISGQGEVVSTINLENEITVTGDFYNQVAPLIKTYDECLKTNDGKRFNEFFNEFLKAYNENEGYGITLSDSERKPMSIYLKTGAVMLVFIAVAILLGYFLFRKKNKVLKPYEVDELMKEVKAEADAKESAIEAEDVQELIANDTPELDEPKKLNDSTDAVDSDELDEPKKVESLEEDSESKE